MNPRYFSATKQGRPTKLLVQKLALAHNVFHSNIDWFCGNYQIDQEERRNITDVQGVYLIGSHATSNNWQDDTSDVDFKLLVPNATQSNLLFYKRDVLDKLLHGGEKRDWVDLWFAQRDDQIMLPRYDLTRYWLDFNKKAPAVKSVNDLAKFA